MRVLLCLCVCLLLGAALALTDADAIASDLPNTREENPDQYNKIIVGPLDAEFYGLDSEDEDDDVGDDEPLGDIEDEIEEILDDLDQVDDELVEEVVEEEVVEEEGVDDDDDGNNEQVPQDENQENGRRGRGKGRNRQLWRKFGRKSSRQVSRFMHKRNLTNIEDVPPKRFSGAGLSKVHRRARQQGAMAVGNKPMRRLYKKVTRKVNRRTTQEESNYRIRNVCRTISKRSSPRRGLLKKVPTKQRQELRQMFTARKRQLSECCQMDTEARQLCFSEAYVDKMNQICRLNISQQQQPGSRQGLKFKKWQRKSDCCEIVDDEERGECFHEVGASIKAEKKVHQKNRKTPETRLEAVCRKVDSPIGGPWFKKLFSQMNAQETSKWKTIFQQRRNDMKECCERQATHSMLECAEDLKELRYERVCSGDEDFKPEPRYNAQKHGLLVETCCQLQGAPRYMCFNKKGRNLKPTQSQTQSIPATDLIKDGSVEFPARPVVRPNGQGELVVEVEITEDLGDDEEVEEEVLVDMMMGDAPARSLRSLQGRRRRKNRNQPTVEVRRVKRDCCEQGKILGQSFPNDGKAITVRQEQCAANSEVYAADFDDQAEMCQRIYNRCCNKRPGSPDRQGRPGRLCPHDDDDGHNDDDHDGGRRDCVRGRGRAGRRRNRKKVHMNVEVNGEVEDIDEIVAEVEETIEDIAKEM